MKGSIVCAACVCMCMRSRACIYCVVHVCMYVCICMCDVEHCVWMYGTYVCMYVRVCIAWHSVCMCDVEWNMCVCVWYMRTCMREVEHAYIVWYMCVYACMCCTAHVCVCVMWSGTCVCVWYMCPCMYEVERVCACVFIERDLRGMEDHHKEPYLLFSPRTLARPGQRDTGGV